MLAAAVFDNDGLLLDTEQAWTRAETRLFARYGHVFTPAHKAALIGTSAVAAAVSLEAMLGRPGAGRDLVAELGLLVLEEAEAGIEPRPGAMQLVEALIDAGVPVGVASNSNRLFLDLVLERAGLAGRFAITVAGDEVVEPKPAPDLYLDACRLLGAAPADSVALEDSPTGVAAARAAGLRIVGVPYLPELAGELAADLVATSLAAPEVAAFLGLAPTIGPRPIAGPPPGEARLDPEPA